MCVKWYRIIVGLTELNKNSFKDCFKNGEISWWCFEQPNSATVCSVPTERHSHSSAIIGHNLYVFGGLSATSTSYNDLWIFNLNDKTWLRPMSTGSYPSPKAAATLLAVGNESLLLYGGYSHPFSYPFNQQVNFFDELHTFCTQKHLWRHVVFSQEAPRLAGHSASVINQSSLILFGGCNSSLGNKSNAVHCYHIVDNCWVNVIENGQQGTVSQSAIPQRRINGYRPEARYGHSQISLDDERVLIVGGCGGPNKQYDDVWILHWPKDMTLDAAWCQIKVNSLINSPSQLYCIPFVQCDDKLITFGKPRSSSSSKFQSMLCSLNGGSANSTAKTDAAFTLCGSVKSLKERVCSCSPSSDSDDEAHGQNQEPTILNKTQLNTIKRLEALKKIAEKFNDKLKEEKELKILEQLNSTASLGKKQRNCLLHSKIMQVFVLDIGRLISNTGSDLCVDWQTPISHFTNAPGETILYSLCKGIDEIVLFGGMEIVSNSVPNIKPSYEQVRHKVSNKLYIMKPKNVLVNSV